MHMKLKAGKDAHTYFPYCKIAMVGIPPDTDALMSAVLEGILYGYQSLNCYGGHPAACYCQWDNVTGIHAVYSILQASSNPGDVFASQLTKGAMKGTTIPIVCILVDAAILRCGALQSIYLFPLREQRRFYFDGGVVLGVSTVTLVYGGVFSKASFSAPRGTTAPDETEQRTFSYEDIQVVQTSFMEDIAGRQSHIESLLLTPSHPAKLVQVPKRCPSQQSLTSLSTEAINLGLTKFYDRTLWRSLLRCRLVCKFLRSVTHESTTAQYAIELAVAGMEDIRTSLPYSITMQTLAPPRSPEEPTFTDAMCGEDTTFLVDAREEGVLVFFKKSRERGYLIQLACHEAKNVQYADMCMHKNLTFKI
ncbi:hypothetical protein BDR03DRAFT_987672 [Suillus americanus]|nr:hypothetical protein BDR03DRAFT_987672 [Suillus americanus]